MTEEVRFTLLKNHNKIESIVYEKNICFQFQQTLLMLQIYLFPFQVKKQIKCCIIIEKWYYNRKFLTYKRTKIKLWSYYVLSVFSNYFIVLFFICCYIICKINKTQQNQKDISLGTILLNSHGNASWTIMFVN